MPTTNTINNVPAGQVGQATQNAVTAGATAITLSKNADGTWNIVVTFP